MTTSDTDVPAEVWREYVRTRDPAIQELVVLKYQPLVRYVAGTVAARIPAHVSRDDLISYGNEGLLDAISKYDPDRGVRFQAYAVLRIRGSITDGLRSVDWVPRKVRAKVRKVDAAFVELEALLGRPPTTAELAEVTGHTERELGTLAQETASANFVPLDAQVMIGREGDRTTEAELITDVRAEDPEVAAMVAEMKSLLAVAITRLAEHLRIVVSLVHFHGLSIAEVSEVLGVTESRVCQLLNQALLALARVPL